jgi:hypothetical protein
VARRAGVTAGNTLVEANAEIRGKGGKQAWHKPDVTSAHKVNVLTGRWAGKRAMVRHVTLFCHESIRLK